MGSVEERPYLVSWNLTRRCNLSCPHCYLDAGGRSHSELTTDEANRVLQDLAALNPSLMLVLTGGEPLLREDLPDLIEEASRTGFLTVLGSNGTLLTQDILKDFKEAGLKGLGVSIDSVESADHDAFRGRAGAWEQAVHALRRAREVGIETQLDVTLTDANWEGIDRFVDLGVSLKARAVNFFFLVCTGRAARTAIATDHYEEALKRIAKASLQERRLMVRARCAPHIYRLLYEGGCRIPEGTRGCLAGRSYLRIDPEGNVTPCPYMPLSVGNVREKPLSAIWREAPELQRLREAQYAGRCGPCEYADLCGGCRARAFSAKGSFLEEDPLCRYQPRGGERVALHEAFRGDLQWTEEAKERIKRVPFFMQGIITRIIESKAQERGVNLVTAGLLDEIKGIGHPGKMTQNCDISH